MTEEGAGDLAAAVADLRPRVYRFVLRQVGEPETAEDLTQEALAEAFRGLSRYRGSARLSTWVLGIALNRIRNHHNRDARRHQDTDGGEILDSVPDTDPSVDTARSVESRRLVAAVDRAMQDLAPELREAIVLVVLEGLPYDQAAGVAGIPTNTMKNRVLRARRALRRAVAPDGA